MKTLRETENKMKKLEAEVANMTVGRSQAIQNLMGEVASLKAQLAAHIADKKAHKDGL